MADYKHNFYGGANYGLEPVYGDKSSPMFVGYNLPQSAFGVPTDPRTANQIKAVSDKINTGVKSVEVTGVSLEVLDYIPKQHFKEIARLKELTGIDLTFHGPLVEPSGTTQEGWDPAKRMLAERQVTNALERAQDLGNNVVVTFHSSNGLPEPKTVVIDPATGKPTTTQLWVVDPRTGRAGVVPKRGANHFLGTDSSPETELKELNKQNWSQQMSGITLEADRARKQVDEARLNFEKIASRSEDGVDEETILKLYRDFDKEPQEYKKMLKTMDSVHPNASRVVDRAVSELAFAKRFAEESYIGLQGAFNQAYEYVQMNPKGNEEVKAKLERLKEELAPQLKEYYQNPEKLIKFTEAVKEGVNTLNSIDVSPSTYRPLREFAIEKSAETFANAAFNAYNANKGDVNKVPIISIENPPVGMGLSRANDLSELVDKSRENLAHNLMEKKGLSEKKAGEIAEKMIGVTWDVGHINMLRRYGFGDSELKKETEKIGPYVKHIHLSDNFGMEHTELPMGMGNVPIKEHEEILKKQLGEKFKNIKQVVETGGWYQYFKTTPLAETFEAFGSAIYPMKAGSYWNASRGTTGSYFTGYGRMLPEVNFATYGAGFSALPAELGGQIGGTNNTRNRLSGAPME